jgi:hypothetical protein
VLLLSGDTQAEGKAKREEALLLYQKLSNGKEASKENVTSVDFDNLVCGLHR